MCVQMCSGVQLMCSSWQIWPECCGKLFVFNRVQGGYLYWLRYVIFFFSIFMINDDLYCVMIILWLVCDNVISTVRFYLFKLVKFSFLFSLICYWFFITPVNKDYQIENVSSWTPLADEASWHGARSKCLCSFPHPGTGCDHQDYPSSLWFMNLYNLW